MKAPNPGIATRALLAVCALLGLVVVGESLTGASENFGNAPRTAVESVELPELAAIRYVHPSLDTFTDVLERPIFMETRRLPEEVVVEAPPPVVPLRLELEGVAMAGDTRIAVLRDLASKALVQLGEGATYNGWLLESISADKATFSRDRQIEELRLELAASVPPRR